MLNEKKRWSLDTFGRAQLGDERRVRRLVQMGARAAEQPDGRLSSVFGSAKEREGAYDFVENDAVDEVALGTAVFSAAARAGRGYPFVWVPVDGTSLKLWDGTGRKDFGSIGTYASKATGLKVINALVLSPEGVPLGLGGQIWWRRPREKPVKRHHSRRPVEEKETRHCVRALGQVCDAFEEHAPTTQPWFQIDRGGDVWSVMRSLIERDRRFTIRNAVDRRLVGHPERRLRKTLKNKPVRFHCQLQVPRRVGHKVHPDRRARTANLSVRVASVELRLQEKRTDRLHPTKINAVMIRESRTTPCDEQPICWVLLTNAPIATEKEIRREILGYTQRWRIEEFHKTWKTGACNIERSQLHSSRAVMIWATILAAVAVRIERLKFLARSSPNEPASAEFSKSEIDALRLLRSEYGPTSEEQPDALTIGTATRWIADLGGYTGKSSGGPPGTITIGRGLERLKSAAQVLELIKRPPK